MPRARWQVVHAVSPIPVVASGGIFDGRGIAAALMLGAVGVKLGTRFNASNEAPGSEEWKQTIIHANSEDSINVEVLNDISPVPGSVGFGTVLPSLPTPFLDEWSGKREEPRRDRDRLRGEILATHQAGRPQQTLLTAGQTAGGIKEILPVAEIMQRLVAETRSGPVAGGGLSLRPPRMARIVPGHRPAQYGHFFTGLKTKFGCVGGESPFTTIG
jgi:nitronate monooxygenase/enoyl-[acyl-carrier protein] reductase II